jgi:hypothetical protein
LKQPLEAGGVQRTPDSTLAADGTVTIRLLNIGDRPS